MFLFFLSFFSKVFNERANYLIVNQSWTVPVIMFCFSPYCGHCKEIHPDYTKAGEEYKEDPNIVFAEIDCFEFHEICSKFYKVQGYPTFTTIIKGISKGFEGGRDYEGFKRYAEQLKEMKMDEMCGNFNLSDPSSIEFPAIVMKSKDSLKESCSFIDNLAYKNDMKELVPNFYAIPNQDELSFEIYLDNETKIPMESKYSLRNLKKFINEYKNNNFENLKWSQVFSHKRPLCIVVTKEGIIPDNFRIFSNKIPSYYWSSVTYKKLVELADGDLSITNNDFPAVIITNDKKNKYSLIKNATVDILKPLLQQDFESLPNIQNKYLKFVFRDLVLFPGKKINRKLVVGCIFVGIIMLIVFAFYSITQDPYLKFE